jgi:diguanylate cyclase (GGDEF)-like protein/PAS domain S-box-containing protein
VSDREGSIRIGVYITVFVVAGCAAYALATWDQENRSLILVVLAVALAGGLSLLLLPADRIVASRRREVFFLAWSAFDVILIGGLALADGGIDSPYAFVLTLPLVFAAASYPLGPFVAVIGMTLLTLVPLALAGEGHPLENDLFFGGVLAALGVLCAWQVGDQAGRRKAMAGVEAALAETERAAGAILESAYEAYVAIDADGVITNWNRRAEAMFGFTREEALGCELAETIIPEDFREPHRRGLRRFVESGDGPLLGKRIVMTARGRDGNEFPVELAISPVEIAGSHSFHAFIEDVSARQAAEHQLRESEDRFRTLIQGASDYALFPLDAEGRVEDWNEGAQRIYGYAPSGICGKPLTQLLPRGHEAEARAALREAEEKGRVELEARQVRDDGSGFLANVIITPVRARSGKVRGYVSVVRDITVQRSAQNALREAEERFRGAFEAAPVGIALVDLAPHTLGRILQANAALSEIAGRGVEELLETALQEISHPDDASEGLDLLQDLLVGSARRRSIECRFLRPDGEVVWTSLGASIVRDPAGASQYAVVQVQDVSDRKRFERQLQYLADHDALTGLLNRRRFEQELRQQVALADRHARDGTVLVVDLDNFKYMNDTLGHAVGDELISRVGKVIEARLRDTDTVARLGGDEFAVLLPETATDEGMRVAEELRDEIGAEEVVGGGRSMRLTVSIGVSRFGGQTKVSAEGVLVNADIAMYEAKAAGRDRVELLDAEGPKTKMRARLTWSERVRGALENDRFELFQQPILELAPDEVTRHELLLRMRDDEGALIGPSTFLYIAEQFGQIHAIDRWVCGEAIALLAERQAAGDDICLEVNLSGASITDQELTESLEGMVRDSGIDGSRLIFEVTETAAIVNLDKARDFAARMAELGCSFALDDFGSGFGSFYYLKHLPFDYLKIDGDFIEKLPDSAADRLTVEAIVRIATGLGKRTIAEFVGDETTVELLREFGVDFAQGYHIGRPVPAADTWESAHQQA